MFSQFPAHVWLLLIITNLSYSLLSCTQRVVTVNNKPIIEVQTHSQHLLVASSVEQIATQVSVRILTPHGSGSGVIIQRAGQIYTVLTNNHVVNDRSEKGYTILTEDGKTYLGKWIQLPQFKNLDVALIQFSSHQSYQLATLAKPNTLTVGDQVYASGFPAWHFKTQNNQITSLESTRDWGRKAFSLTTGLVQLLPKTSLQGGYQIGYTNDVVEGMSGGPVLNQKGELVGINGQLKYPFQGIEAFIFTDGTQPSEQLFRQMEPLSWAIPITTITRFLNTP